MKRGRPKGDDREQAGPVGDVMSMREVTEYLGCSKFTVYRLLRSGEFPGFRLGSDWRFRRSDIERWIMDRQVALDQSAPIKRGRPRRKG
jgi:excisionase family DNA binding protein